MILLLQFPTKSHLELCDKFGFLNLAEGQVGKESASFWLQVQHLNQWADLILLLLFQLGTNSLIQII